MRVLSGVRMWLAVSMAVVLAVVMVVIVAMAMFVVGARLAVVVGVVAVDDVGGYVAVQQSRDGLDAEEPGNEASHDHEVGFLVVPVVVFEVAFGFGKHAVEGGEHLR